MKTFIQSRLSLPPDNEQESLRFLGEHEVLVNGLNSFELWLKSRMVSGREYDHADTVELIEEYELCKRACGSSSPSVGVLYMHFSKVARTRQGAVRKFVLSWLNWTFNGRTMQQNHREEYFV